MRWRVERCGAPGAYAPGWIAYTFGGTGALFASHAEAVDFAQRQASDQAGAGRRALWKLAARPKGADPVVETKPVVLVERYENNPFRNVYVG